jgi:pimeloyl-ACP methyl ester carboxylesterase
MPIFEHGAVRLAYEVHGEGPTVLAIAPGGMRSSIAAWSRSPYDPVAQLAKRFRVVTMDQRNAGDSIGPVDEASGWDMHTGDQLALLDHLGADRFAVIGMCIGGAYAAGLIRHAPERVAAAVMLQPIGLEDNRQAFFDIFGAWRADIASAHPEANDAVWDAYRQRMFGGDFLFSASRQQVAAIRTPLLVLMGDDLYHPQSTSRAIAELAPGAELVERWKAGDDLAAASSKIADFLATHHRA